MLVTDKSTSPINRWRKTSQNREKQKITHNTKEQETDSGSKMSKSMETKSENLKELERRKTQ